MAEGLLPGTTQPEPADVNPPSQQAPQSDLASQWRGWISQPANRAALIQFGISLMQPIGLGQSAMGHVGQALGQAGEAQGRVAATELAGREQVRKEEETASRGDLREARADAAAARANTAGTRAAAQTERLQSTQERMRLSALIKAQALYQKEVAAIHKRNADSRLTDPTKPAEPIPSWDEWLKRFPEVGSALGTSGPPGAEPGTKYYRVAPGALNKYPDAQQAPDGQWYIQR